MLEHHACLVALAGFLCYDGVGRAEAEVPTSAKDPVKYVAFDLYVACQGRGELPDCVRLGLAMSPGAEADA
jgi:hypothetical protein